MLGPSDPDTYVSLGPRDVGHVDSENDEPTQDSNVTVQRKNVRRQSSRKATRLDQLIDSREDSAKGSAKDSSIVTFGTYMRGLSQSFWISMVFGGFVAPGGGKGASSAWRCFFLFAMALCGSTCFINCFIRDPPFHVLPVDVMVAGVHIPGAYSIFFWHRVLSQSSSAIWRILQHDEQSLEELKVAVGLLGPLAIPAQIVVVALVYAGYAVPAQMFVNEGVEDGAGGKFTLLHTYSMWFVIPPVVACVVANAAFFSFFVYGLYLQVDHAVVKMKDRERDFLTASAEIIKEEIRSEARAGHLIQHNNFEENAIQPSITSRSISQMSSLRDADHEAYMSLLTDTVFELQDSIDAACQEWSSLVFLFLSIAFCAFLAVLYDCVLVYNQQATYELSLWNKCIDLFLMAVGLGIMLGFLVMGAMLTQRMDELCIEAVQLMRTVEVPISKCGIAFLYLQTGNRKGGIGFKIFGTRIDWSHVIAFLSALLTIVGVIMSTKSSRVNKERSAR